MSLVLTSAVARYERNTQNTEQIRKSYSVRLRVLSKKVQMRKLISKVSGTCADGPNRHFSPQRGQDYEPRIWRQIGDKIETYISRRRIRRFVVILSSYSSFRRNLEVVFLISS